MALKDILVHVDSSESGKMRLHLAADLAARHGARLTALHVQEYGIDQQHRRRSAELELASGGRTDELNRVIESELDEDAEALRGLLTKLQQDRTIDTVWRAVEGRTCKIVPQHSRYADLTIVGQDCAEIQDLPDEYSFAETMLFTSGRPLLIVPVLANAVDARPTLGRKIAIAWNGSRASARAISDGLALIERAERTTMLVVDPNQFAHPARLTPTTILDHVSRHTGSAHYRTLQTGGASIGDVLQAAALEAGADLLVAGAHGRARLWEKMLGGVTFDLLTRMRMPLLIAY